MSLHVLQWSRLLFKIKLQSLELSSAWKGCDLSPHWKKLLFVFLYIWTALTFGVRQDLASSIIKYLFRFKMSCKYFLFIVLFSWFLPSLYLIGDEATYICIFITVIWIKLSRWFKLHEWPITDNRNIKRTFVDLYIPLTTLSSPK